jgi:hypothetical protein
MRWSKVCFNMVVVNPARAPIREIVESVYGKAAVNKHGFSMYTVRDGGELVLRTLNFADFERFVRENVDDNELVHIHFRHATTGAVDERNVHMWRVCGYYVSHNGFVARYVRGRAHDLTGESDTLTFISNPAFCAVLRGEGLDYLLNSGFYGVLFATNKSSVIVLAREKPVQVYYDDSTGVLIFANEEIDYKVGFVSAYGFTFKKRGLLRTTVSDALIHFNTRKMVVEKHVDLVEYIWHTWWAWHGKGKAGDEWLDWLLSL